MFLCIFVNLTAIVLMLYLFVYFPILLHHVPVGCLQLLMLIERKVGGCTLGG